MDFLSIAFLVVYSVLADHILLLMVKQFDISFNMSLDSLIITIGVWVSCQDVCKVFLKFVRQRILVVLNV